MAPMSFPTHPDVVLRFTNNEPIEIFYKKAHSYRNCRAYDSKLMSQPLVWHQVIVHHKGKTEKLTGIDSKTVVMDAIFNLIAGEEFYPVAYRMGESEDRFLVRSCKAALDKMFLQNLRLPLGNSVVVNLTVELCVAEYKANQISPVISVSQALLEQFNELDSIDDVDGILNLSNFSRHRLFKDIVVNLGNRATFDYVCSSILKNYDNFRKVKGINLSNNGLTNLSPLRVFNGINFRLMDLRNNEITSSHRFCDDMKQIKTEKLLLEGNPIVKSKRYPECLIPILKNFKIINGIPAKNFTKEYTPLNYDVDMECDGHRIDWTNKTDFLKYQKSSDWHAVVIPDVEEKFTKEQILTYFFLTLSAELSEIYPCFYKYSDGEHKFLLRECDDQICYLIEKCNLEITIPDDHPIPSSSPGGNTDFSSGMQADHAIAYYIRMNVSKFKHGQIEPLEKIAKALHKRFNAMDRLLNLDNFQNTEGLENIVVNMNSTKILGRILVLAWRKYQNQFVELCLSGNKIVSVKLPSAVYSTMSLRGVDLTHNWIENLSDIKDLNEVGIKSLLLDGNPVCSKYTLPSEYIRAVRKYFPDLYRLDNVELTSKNKFHSQKNFLCNLSGYDFVEPFLQWYFETFESDRSTLQDWYHPQAIFTLTCNNIDDKITTHLFKRIHPYTNIARNILKMNDLSRAYTSTFVGPFEIISALVMLPDLLHDPISMTTDTIVFNSEFVVITVHGVFIDRSVLEADVLLAFTRTFVLVPVERNSGELKGSTKYKIKNDQLNIMGPTMQQSKNSFKFGKSDCSSEEESAVSVAEKEALLVILQQVTNLKRVWCSRCLEDGKWDFPKALEVFASLNKNKEIPDTAFI